MVTTSVILSVKINTKYEYNNLYRLIFILFRSNHAVNNKRISNCPLLYKTNSMTLICTIHYVTLLLNLQMIGEWASNNRQSSFRTNWIKSLSCHIHKCTHDLPVKLNILFIGPLTPLSKLRIVRSLCTFTVYDRFNLILRPGFDNATKLLTIRYLRPLNALMYYKIYNVWL